MKSIRDRLNLSIIASMAVLLTIAAVVIYLRIGAELEQVFDEALYDKAQGLISLTELDEEGLEFDFAEDGVFAEFVEHAAPQYYELRDARGELLVKSPTLGEAGLPMTGVAAGFHRYADLRLADGRDGRLIEIGFLPRVEIEDEPWEEDSGEIEAGGDPAAAEPLVLGLARERETLDATLAALALTVGGIFALVLAISAWLVRRHVEGGLEPLARFARQVAGIDEHSLGRQLPDDGGQSIEIAPIHEQINHLLERLQSAFEREKRFSANVAHELRTPLSELRTLAEVGRMLPADDPRTDAFFADVGDISTHMEKVVVTLLELARSDAGLLVSEPEDIDLEDFCAEIWRQAINGNARGKTLVQRIPPGLVIHTDPEKLGMILTNLLGNALSYSPQNAAIEIAASIVAGRVRLEVRNAAVDLKAEDIVHMRDRFWRKQPAGHDGTHSGLGLTLVDALARILHLEVELKLDEERTFRVALSGLPLALGAGT